jgi:hypothetical protein
MWEIDIEADSPVDAAIIAKQIQLNPASIANMFTVTDTQCRMTDIDLDDYKEA